MNNLLILAGIIFILSCTNTDKKEAVKTGTISSDEKSSTLVENYIGLKDALVTSDEKAAGEAARKLKQDLHQEGHMEMSEIASSITNTETLEDQRELFKTLSEHLIEGLENTGSDQPIYVQYCPMAFDNEGASWISLSDEILNPYFGDQMLHCGSVLKIIE